MTINIGNNNINKILVGNTEIDKIYLGNNLIYNKPHLNTKLVTSIGNPIITNNGQVSNFNINDYILINNPDYLVVNNNIKWVFDFNTGSDILTDQILFQCPGVYENIQLCISNGAFKYWSSDANGDGIKDDGWNIIKENITTNTNYIIRISFPDLTTIQFEEFTNNNWNILTNVKVIDLNQVSSCSIGRANITEQIKYYIFKGTFNLSNSYVQLTENNNKEYLYIN